MLSRLGKFDIVKLLAEGSMGEVYLGRDPILHREVAVKVIRPAQGMSPLARERFATEARAAGALNHPNIVTIHEMGEEQGVLYLAMELVKGDDLATLIRTGNLAPRDALEVLAQVCDALEVAHRHRILHRDLKPSNIRVAWDGQRLAAKLLDFGVAKVRDADITDEGLVFGTVNYMAPEYLQSGRADARSDLFSVGVILYETLAGTPPFDGPTPGSIVYRLIHEAPPALPPGALRGISRDVQALVSRALAKDPATRYASAEALAAHLRAARDPAWRLDLEPPTLAGVPAAGDRARPTAPTPPRGAIPPLPPSDPRRREERPSDPARRADVGLARVPVQVQRDLLETTRQQLLRALEVDPANPRILGLLLATHYRMGWPEAVRQTLDEVRRLGLPGRSLLEVPRCAEAAREEARARRLPPELHEAFLALLAR